ncbi:MAG: type II toxin-antitoxin system RelE/ParE family toxin [Gammaproteobacteria bacterium]|nr:type II toxin-antitoxin system RelE/ParE family toxin [Gammaproteobacteria bacterium]
MHTSDNINAAKILVQTVFAKVDRLKKFPNSGRKPPELENSRYREVIVGPCRVFYRATKSRVLILHVVRNERKLRKMLIEERDREGN